MWNEEKNKSGVGGWKGGGSTQPSLCLHPAPSSPHPPHHSGREEEPSWFLDVLFPQIFQWIPFSLFCGCYAVTFLQRGERAGLFPPGVFAQSHLTPPFPGPVAAFPLVGRGSAQASQNPGQGQAALSRSLSSLPAHLPPSPFAPWKTSCTPPPLPLLMIVWPRLSTSLLSHHSPQFGCPSVPPKAPEKLVPTVHFPGNSNICASLQASSRASLPSSLRPREAKCWPRPSGGPGALLPGRLCWVQGDNA